MFSVSLVLFQSYFLHPALQWRDMLQCSYGLKAAAVGAAWPAAWSSSTSSTPQLRLSHGAEHPQPSVLSCHQSIVAALLPPQTGDLNEGFEAFFHVPQPEDRWVLSPLGCRSAGDADPRRAQRAWERKGSGVLFLSGRCHCAFNRFPWRPEKQGCR